MAFIPYKRFIIETALRTDKVMELILKVVQPKRFLPNFFSSERKQYEGTVSKDGFKIVRNVYYLNSFLPLIKGKFHSSDRGTRIIIIMAGHPFVAVSMAVALTLFGYFLITYLMGIISGLFVILGCLVLNYIIYTFAFTRESKLDRNFLVDLFSEGYK